MVSYTELCCQYLSAHQHSQHLLCLSLHNYTSWSCFLSPPDHLFPAANLLSVPASTLYTLYNPPCWVNLSIDVIFSPSPARPAPVIFRSARARAHMHTQQKPNRSLDENDSVIYTVSEVFFFFLQLSFRGFFCSKSDNQCALTWIDTSKEQYAIFSLSDKFCYVQNQRHHDGRDSHAHQLFVVVV